MPFRLSKEAREWFKHVRADFDLEFDTYYLCLMVGLVTGTKKSLEDKATSELVNNFPGPYLEKGRLIIATYLSRVLVQHKIQAGEREQIEAVIRQRITPDDGSHLTSLGLKELNEYSHGGFEVLADMFGDKPRAIETFLPKYAQAVHEAAKSKFATLGSTRP